MFNFDIDRQPVFQFHKVKLQDIGFLHFIAPANCLNRARATSRLQPM